MQTDIEAEVPVYKMPLLGEDALSFSAQTTRLVGLYNVSTSVNWKSGESVLMPVPSDIQELIQRIEKTPDDIGC